MKSNTNYWIAIGSDQKLGLYSHPCSVFLLCHIEVREYGGGMEQIFIINNSLEIISSLEATNKAKR